MTALAKLERFGARTALILGSGLSPLAEAIESEFTAEYREIPGLAVGKVAGHPGRFVAGRLGGVKVLAACGRAHLYEGWTAREVAAGVRTIARCGVSKLIVCNSAGSLDPALEPGMWMMISDHINLTAQSPLAGEPGFVDMTDAYSPRLRKVFAETARGLGIPAREGVYAAVLGPQFETPAEIRMLRAAGADAVGMSTVHEVIQARALGLEVAGFSAISNRAAGLGGHPLSHEEVLESGRGACGPLRDLITPALARL